MGAKGWAVGAALAAAVGAGLLGAAAAAPSQEKPAKPKVEDLAWLAGTWRSDDDHGLYEEHWLPPASGCMAGVFRAVEGGTIDMYELLAIETREGGTPVMFIRHFHGGLEPWSAEAGKTPSWPLKESGKGKAVFEDPATAFPRSIAYRLVDEKTLEVRLEGAPGSTRPPLEFRLKKSK